MKAPSGIFTTVTVKKSFAAAEPSGKVALCFETREVGTIAFEVDMKAISSIRKNLVECEKILSQKSGNA